MTYLSILGLLLLLAEPGYCDNEVGFLRDLRRRFPAWKPNAVVDVGANVGGWTKEAQAIFPGTSTFMVEATPKHRVALEGVKQQFSNQTTVVDFRIDLLSNEDGKTFEFYQGKNTGNSIFREQTDHYVNDVPVIHNSVTLDTALKESRLRNTRVDYFKLDVQGAELLVLQGASELLKQVTFVQLEVSLVEYNKGGACFADIDWELEKHGFRLYDIAHLNRNVDAFKSHGIGQLDLLYVQPNSEHRPPMMKDLNAQFCSPKSLTRSTPVSAATTSIDAAQMLVGSGTLPTGFLHEEAAASINRDLRTIVVFFSGFLGGILLQRARGFQASQFKRRKGYN